ncbi:MAG: hypothetical protein R6V40_03890 [Candidatus Moraniibacteriota bacterium]
MKTIRVLILEDDLKACGVILRALEELDFEAIKKQVELSAVVLQEYGFVEEFVNDREWSGEDIVFLDREADKGEPGSFHELDFEKFNKDRIISISSVPDFNEEAREKGIHRVAQKDFTRMEEFGEKIREELRDILGF